jgi:hypothetical protein
MDLRKAYEELMAVRAIRPDEFGPEAVAEEIERDRNVAPEIASGLEWDDTVAGHRYRVDQVRKVMARVTELVAVRQDDLPQERRALHAVRQPAHGGPQFVWAPTREILAKPDDHEKVLADFRGQIYGLVRRYRELLPADRMRDVLTGIARDVEREHRPTGT